jgi:hypothetical protein
VDEDLALSVTGTVEESFDVAGVEDEPGVHLDDALHADGDGEDHLVAGSVGTSVAPDQ